MTAPVFISINKGLTAGSALPAVALEEEARPEEWYRRQGYSYPKFFKMDVLCKWAWLGAEALLKTERGWRYDGIDKEKIGVMLATGRGCLEVDKRYRQSMEEIPSPALFVYTLPNIMLGEICIRHGFKGEQLCLVDAAFDVEAACSWVADGLDNRGMEACLFGWADAAGDEADVTLFWASRRDGGLDQEQIENLFRHRTAQAS